MATDDALVARALLTVLRATVSAVSEFPGHVMYLPSWRARTDEEMAQELALQPVPRRWIAVNWTGMLAIGCWDLEESENQRLRSPEVDGLRRTVSAETADRAPTIFIRGGSNFVVTDVDHAVRFQQLHSLPLCGRRICDVRQHELRSLLRDQYGALDSDYVLEYHRLRDGGGMHAIPLDGITAKSFGFSGDGLPANPTAAQKKLLVSHVAQLMSMPDRRLPRPVRDFLQQLAAKFAAMWKNEPLPDEIANFVRRFGGGNDSEAPDKNSPQS
jgi:hypothetical protein